ncbi:MAG: YraN family protein [Gemmatimonadetes bacterium]|nr:YraN family protein [Gemmatimonadota bacterium]
MAFKSDPAGWKDPRHRRGAEGEATAGAFLERSGWTILEHRFRMGRLEIDLVARRGATVAFVEVKTRLGAAFGHPVEAITWAKRREICRVAQAWIHRHGRPGYDYRLAVVGITLHGRKAPEIQLIEDAFRVGWR